MPITKMGFEAWPSDILHGMLTTILNCVMLVVNVVKRKKEAMRKLVVSLAKHESVKLFAWKLDKRYCGNGKKDIDDEKKRKKLSMKGNGCRFLLHFWKRVLIDPLEDEMKSSEAIQLHLLIISYRFTLLNKI